VEEAVIHEVVNAEVCCPIAMRLLCVFIVFYVYLSNKKQTKLDY